MVWDSVRLRPGVEAWHWYWYTGLLSSGLTRILLTASLSSPVTCKTEIKLFQIENLKVYGWCLGQMYPQ